MPCAEGPSVSAETGQVAFQDSTLPKPPLFHAGHPVRALAEGSFKGSCQLEKTRRQVLSLLQVSY